MLGATAIKTGLQTRVQKVQADACRIFPSWMCQEGLLLVKTHSVPSMNTCKNTTECSPGCWSRLCVPPSEGPRLVAPRGRPTVSRSNSGVRFGSKILFKATLQPHQTASYTTEKDPWAISCQAEGPKGAQFPSDTAKMSAPSVAGPSSDHRGEFPCTCSIKDTSLKGVRQHDWNSEVEAEYRNSEVGCCVVAGSRTARGVTCETYSNDLHVIERNDGERKASR